MDILLTSIVISGLVVYLYIKQKQIKLVNPETKTFQMIDSDIIHPETHPDQTSNATTVLRLYQMAADMTYLFDMFGIHAWVSGSTLLGAIRHGGLIPWEPRIEFSCFAQEKPGFGQLLLTNTLRAYGYQVIEYENQGYMIYMGAEPDVKIDLYWVESPENKQIYPINRNLLQTPHHSDWGTVEDIEPRRKWAFGATEVYVPCQYETMLTKQEGQSWRHLGEDPGLIPIFIQQLPWYRSCQPLLDTKPATPIGPLRFPDRGMLKISRDLDLLGKFT